MESLEADLTSTHMAMPNMALGEQLFRHCF
jgi:hypothetical protein